MNFGLACSGKEGAEPKGKGLNSGHVLCVGTERMRLLLRNEISQMRWFKRVVSIAPEVLPGEVVCPTEKRPLQKDLGHSGGTM